MAKERVQRRLAAILAADVVGYSRMMSADEPGTLSRLRTIRSEILDPKIEQFGGRIFKTTGDGALAEFGSAVNAVQCSVEIQRELSERNADAPEDQRMALRIGISLGDVVVEGEDLYGNGVNVAARMEGLAEPGGICVSGNVQEHVSNTLKVAVEDLGEQSVKNIERPIRCYRVLLKPGAIKIASSTLYDRPAVAVLPFENMSGDPEQEYFADGLTEDIITALSLWRSFPVIARNSTFSFKGTSPDVRKIGAELGAAYVVEGSVRKAGNRVRVTAQLINAESGHHLWAERYDRDYEDIFDLQDEITLRIAATVEPEIEKVEKQRVAVNSPNDLSAWEYCLRGDALVEEHNEGANKEAREMFIRATELDPQYARAQTGLAFTYVRDLRFWNPDNREEWERLFSETARRAVALDGSNAKARTMLARVYLRAKDYEAAIAETRRAVECNPYDAYTNNMLGDFLVATGRFEEGLPLIERSRKLNPMDIRAHLIDTHMALGNLGAGNYEKSIEHAREAIRRKADFPEPHVLLASALGYLGRKDEALAALEPFGVSALQYYEREPQYAEATKNCIREGLNKAGLLDIASKDDIALPLPDKPSIAVLPFENMSGDPEQEYFADGLTEDLTAVMASWKALPVIGRNSSFTFKDKRASAREVCRTLGARYLVDGSVRKSGNRIRISCGLVDGDSGNHLWSQRYDRELNDIFDLQDEITRTIAVTLEPELEKVVLSRSGGKAPADLNAWDYWLRGMAVLSEFNRKATPQARDLFEKAFEIDPGYARASAYISFTYHRELLMQAAVDVDASVTKCMEWAQKAVVLDSADYISHWALALAYMQTGDSPRMLEEARNAYLMNPNWLESIRTMGTALLNNGQAVEAVPYLEEAIRLNPVDPRSRMHSRTAALAHFHSGNYARTVELARQAINAGVDYADIDWVVVAALGHLGENAVAQNTLQQLGLPNRIPVEFQYPAHERLTTYKSNLIDGLRKAGVSE